MWHYYVISEDWGERPSTEKCWLASWGTVCCPCALAPATWVLKYLFELMHLRMFYSCGTVNQDGYEIVSLDAENKIWCTRFTKVVTAGKTFVPTKSLLGEAVEALSGRSSGSSAKGKPCTSAHGEQVTATPCVDINPPSILLPPPSLWSSTLASQKAQDPTVFLSVNKCAIFLQDRCQSI